MFVSGIKFQNYSMAPKSRRLSYEESVNHYMDRVNLIQKLKISATKEMDSYSHNPYADQCFGPKPMVSIIIATLYPLFLQSQEYETAVNFIPEETPCDVNSSKESAKSQYRDSSKSHRSRYSLTTALSTRLMSFRGSAKRALSFSSPRFSMKHSPDYRRIELLYLDDIEGLSAEELDALLLKSEWATDCMDAVEHMSASLSIASAPVEESKESAAIPHSLVYVNEAFETLTQFKRRDILGGCCKFLQSSTSEKEQLAVMAHCVAHGQPCKVAVCNTRKDGSEFVNFIALHPVYVGEEYKYVVGVQYDASAAEASIKEIKLIEDYLIIVSNLLR